MTKYYKLSDDVAVPGRWELGKLCDARGEEIWPALLMRGEPAQIEGRIRVPVKMAGQPLDFSHAAFGIPVVHVRVAAVFMDLAGNDAQFFPVDIEGDSEQYRILNVTQVVKCIDDQASEEVRYWKPEDGRPEKTGQYRAVYGLRIAPSKVGEARVFRTWGWTVALVVSEELKDALDRIGASGTKFKEV
ncbi:imm11 family protein [Cystobacter fuscus]